MRIAEAGATVAAGNVRGLAMRRIATLIAVTALATGTALSRPSMIPDAHDHPSAAGSSAGYQPCAAEADTSFRGASYARCVRQEAALSAAVGRRLAELREHPEQAGCLGKDEVTCLATLARSVVVTTSLAQSTDLVTSVPSSINGEPGHKLIAISLFAPAAADGPTQPARVTMSLDQGAIVTALNVQLPADPMLARTSVDWDATGIYVIARAVLGTTCISEDRLTFYREVDARMKEDSTTSRSFSSGPDATIGETTGASTQKCGANVRFASVSGESAMHGVYGGGMVNFSLPRDQWADRSRH